jgi:hypothetical protein
MKDVFKLLAPYVTTIASAIALYASFQTRLGVLEYRTDNVEKRSEKFVSDIGTIKDLLYAIDSKMNVYAAIVDERTARK